MKTINVLDSLKMLVLCSALCFVQACDDEKETPMTEEEEVEIAQESNDAENTMDEDVQDFEGMVAESESDGGRIAEACVVVTRDSEAKTITLDFGDGCVGPHGRERSGKVIITYGGEFGDNLANRVITFEDYFVNDKQITGRIELRDFNLNAEGHLTLTRKLVDYTVHFPDGHEFKLNGSRTVEWIDGQGDDDRSNDVLSITGSYTGESTRGRKVEFTIIEPVIASFPCRAEGKFLRVDGKTELKISSASRLRVRTVDYGDGDCDGTIVITINNKILTITL
jgi:hypothetical protein